MSKPLILVTGATGKTGTAVTEQLVAQGFPVRALVHRQDERSRRLHALGAQIVAGDIRDIGVLRAATRDVQRLYFCYTPYRDDLLQVTVQTAIAARDAGVEATVNLSQLIAREDAPSPLTRHHWQAEHLLDWADVGAVHLRPTFFAEMVEILGADGIREESLFTVPFGTGRHSPIAARDIARVAVAILADPLTHVGQRYALTGPRNLDMDEVAQTLSTALGRTVRYFDVPTEPWGQALSRRPGVTDYLVEHLQGAARDHRDGHFSVVTDNVAQLTGKEPMTLAAYLQEHRADFEAVAVTVEA